MENSSYSRAAQSTWSRLVATSDSLLGVSKWAPEVDEALDGFLSASDLLYLYFGQPNRFGDSLISLEQEAALPDETSQGKLHTNMRTELWRLVTKTLTGLLTLSDAPSRHYQRAAESVDYWDLRHQVAISGGAEATFKTYAHEAVREALGQSLPVVLRRGVRKTEASLRNWAFRVFVAASILGTLSVVATIALLWYSTEKLEQSSKEAESRIKKVEDRIDIAEAKSTTLSNNLTSRTNDISSLSTDLVDARKAQEGLKRDISALKASIPPISDEVTRLREGRLISRVSQLETVIRRSATKEPAKARLSVERAGALLAERISDATKLAAQAERTARAEKESAAAAATQAEASAANAKRFATTAEKAADDADEAASKAESEAANAKEAYSQAKDEAVEAKNFADDARDEVANARKYAADAKAEAADAKRSASQAKSKVQGAGEDTSKEEVEDPTGDGGKEEGDGDEKHGQ